MCDPQKDKLIAYTSFMASSSTGSGTDLFVQVKMLNTPLMSLFWVALKFVLVFKGN